MSEQAIPALEEMPEYLRELFEYTDGRVPTYAEMARFYGRKMVLAGEWAGVPIPVEGYHLSIEDRSPYKNLEDFFERFSSSDEDPDIERFEFINGWHTIRTGNQVHVIRSTSTGKSRALVNRFGEASQELRANLQLRTIGLMDVWPIEAEVAAMERLGTLTTPRQRQMYLLTGSFIETSKRSRVSYLFRRLRPTLAVRSGGLDGDRILCALCLHPIGYYEKTFGGSMVPTDDVIAHLTLMRADEPLFWRRANQHPISHPAAGV